MVIRSPTFFACLICFATALARADVQPGDRPTLKFKDFLTHKTIDLADLHGKITIVDFWATWCKPCMAEADHLVAVNTQYSSKGLQFLGISLDSDPQDLKTVMADKKFAWPMSYEGQGWEGSIPKAWGVQSIPQTFIIGPDGDVLWRGHPGAIDEAIASAFKDHPPQLVDPKTLGQAKALLDQVDKALDNHQPEMAVKLLSRIPESAKLDGEVAARSTAASGKLQEFGNGELGAVNSLVESAQYPAAIRKLRDLSLAFTGTPVASAAKAKLAALVSDPRVRQALEYERTETEAADALAVAINLKADKRDALAYPRFKNIVKSFPKTTAATAAAANVKAYEADTAFIARINAKTNGSEAQSLLSMADNYRSAGSTELARKKYQEVIDQFPNTAWATTAGKSIQAIGN